MTDPEQDSLIDAHINKLAPAYQWLRTMEDPRIRSDAARIIDLALTAKLALPPEPPSDDSVRWLRMALEQTDDRQCRRALLDNLGNWLNQVDPPSRRVFLEGLPQLAPAAADLARSGMNEVIAAVNRDPRLMPCIYAFAKTTREIVHSAARLAVCAAVSDMQRLVVLFPLSRVEEDREAERLLGRLGGVPQALPLLLAIAERNVSSACGTARKLRGKLLNQEYLALFEQIVVATGTGSIRWCLGKLPELVSSNQAGLLVPAAVEIARRYGAVAAQAFLEGYKQPLR